VVTRVSAVTASGEVVSSAEVPRITDTFRLPTPAGASVVGVRWGDWVVGADGPGRRPMESTIATATFADAGELVVRATLTTT
jgi:hypothetical protein